MGHVQQRVNDNALSVFTGPVRGWFEESFADPTEAQQRGWPAIAAGEHTLILAPTGSGKTLAAFLWALDRLTAEPTPETKARCRVLYVSPLKALAVDVDRNLRAPLAGIRRVAARAGTDVTEVDVGIRTGDTTAQERRRLQRVPPDVLITTPESLYLMLTSQARETLRSVRTVIVDEIHAVAGTKRGAHLALSLERLEELTDTPPQRIGLSATQRPLDEIAHFLGGQTSDGPRPVTIVDAGARKPLELEVIVPVEDMGALGEVLDEAPTGPASAAPPRASIWPHVHPRLLDLIEAHRSTIVFVNSRRLAERLAARLNELAEERSVPGAPTDVLASDTGSQYLLSTPKREGAGDLVRAHHGSLAREQRMQIEDDLKAGRLRAIVATSSLELGIDMGAVDLVVQVESPGSVARGLQRVGRAGHQVDAPSRGKIFPKYRGDLLEAAVVAQRMRAGLVEETRYPRNPLDVLAQQIVAACALDEWDVDELRALMRRAANYADLSDDVFESVLDLLAGRFPSDEFAGLKPRIVWDRIGGRVRGRDGAQRLAVTNAGTIPDRGLFGVFLPEGTRVGELDEEMVYESRPGETFLLGASTWRIEQITHDRVVVTPAPGEPAKMPFWKGDKPGRPLELGRALGAFVREVGAAPHDDAVARLHDEMGLDDLAAENLVRYLEEQREATGVLPDDRTVIAERFPDEIGDWRMCVLSPFGSRVHAPWALALEARLTERFGLDVQVLWSDDGIVLRLPEAVESIPVEELLIDPDEVEDLVVAQLPSTAMFASRFREASARALLLPRRRPDQRTPLWQQRQRAADLLEVASRYETFPLLLETTRECLRDVFDLSALREVLRDLRSRKVRVVPAETGRASPFAQSLLFGWIAVYMYEGDAPLAERRAAALALDRDLLRDLLGSEELRELLDAGVVAELELELQRLAFWSPSQAPAPAASGGEAAGAAGRSARAARSPDEVHDLLRELGDLSDDEIAARTEGDATAYVDTLVGERRAFRLRVAGEARVAAAEDAARFRDALGAAAPAGLPGAFTEPVPAPLDDLLARYARTHAPFTTADAAARLGVPVDDARAGLSRLAAAERVARGEFRPGGVEREWCDANVLRRLRRRSLAALRHEVEPVEADALARFLPQWQGVGGPGHGPDAVADALGPLQGVPIPASVLEADVLPARVPGYRESALDELCTAGELVWIGAGPLGADDGKAALYFRGQVPLLANVVNDSPPEGPVHDALRVHLAAAGASFWPELVRAAGTADDRVVLTALWDLVWAGEVTNDTLAPLRALGARRSRPGARGRPRPGRITRVGPPAGAGRWSLVAPLLEPAPAPTAAAVARAQQLLDRHGVLTREAARAEGIPGGYASVYPTLRAMEESGKVRRGYFVAGLGAAQFALPGAVDRLRARPTHDEPAILVLAATDPAQPYGAALPWPATEGGKPARAAGAHVVLHDGAPVAFLDRGGHNLVTFPGADGTPETWLEAVAGLVKHGRRRQIEIQRVDGEAVRDATLADSLRAAGFQDSYRGLVLRP